MEKSNLNILLLGSSGIPGRYILTSLLKLKQQTPNEIKITIIKRTAAASNTASPEDYTTVQLNDFSDTESFTNILASVRPHIVISALNAEPEPRLDNHVVDAIQHLASTSTDVRNIFYINGYTLDLLHPSVSALPDAAKRSIQPKVDFAHRLSRLAAKGTLEYCTIVNAAFLDYCLVKGYSAVDLEKQTAMLVDGGDVVVTGCSLDFVGDVVALVVWFYAFGTQEQKTLVRNKRLRVAETKYSGTRMVECVRRITGVEFDVKHDRSGDILDNKQIIRYLNWAGDGAADFSSDGFEFGKDVLDRKSLDELCQVAIANGVQAFDGIGRSL